jgi:hypothetical protein
MKPTYQYIVQNKDSVQKITVLEATHTTYLILLESGIKERFLKEVFNSEYKIIEEMPKNPFAIQGDGRPAPNKGVINPLFYESTFGERL